MSEYGNFRKSWQKGGASKDKGSRGHSRGGGRPQRAIKKFDPSAFIKKVEEQTSAPAYVPKNTFNDFLIDEQIKKNVAAKGYVNPTPIQDEAIPVILEGKDVIGTANTGTGKTASFLIPLVHNVLTKKTNRVLIIAPTRELADQILEELRLFASKTGIHAALCIGGANMMAQIDKLKKKSTVCDWNARQIIGS